MAAPNPYAGTPEDFTETDWKEFARGWAPGTATFTKHGGEHTLLGFCPEVKERAAIRYMLGYEAISNDTTRHLLRTPPIAHPKYDNLYCTGVSATPFKLDARTRGTNQGLKRPAVNRYPVGGRFLPSYTGYKLSQLSLHFEPLPYPVEEDSTTLGGGGGGVTNDNFEFRRWTTWDMTPRVETIALDGQSLTFAEGEMNTAPTTNPKGKPFPADQGFLIVKPDLVVKWHDVPADWVETPNHIPYKILKGLGKVNRYTFGDLGGFSGPTGTLLFYPVGTLLFMGCKITRYPNALYHAGSNASLALGRESRSLLEIEFLFSFFDPDKGRSSNTTIADNYGHNNCFWAGARNATTGALVTGDENSGKWFLATFSGAVGSTIDREKKLFSYYNFAMLFDSWQNNLIPSMTG
jgi:hypothetical protein